MYAMLRLWHCVDVGDVNNPKAQGQYTRVLHLQVCNNNALHFRCFYESQESVDFGSLTGARVVRPALICSFVPLHLLLCCVVPSYMLPLSSSEHL